MFFNFIKSDIAYFKSSNNVDKSKINEQLKVGSPLGRWLPWNQCQTYAWHVIENARTAPAPDPFDKNVYPAP
ncbi:hypothetical protein MKFW12EY_39700 [Methylomonas koyamae]|nr:hypothetical protein MKFW12EY_39700 [Methylomonas koyamae]